MLHRAARPFLALSAALLTLIVGTLLSAGPVFAQVLPPAPVLPGGVHNTSATADSSGMAFWTYVFVAVGALLIGAAVSYGVTRARMSRRVASVTA